MLHWIVVAALQASPAVMLAVRTLPVVFQSSVQLALPADWSMLPPLSFREEPQITPTMQRFVRDELRSGRCKPTPSVLSRGTLTLDLAVLVAPNGFIRRVVPRAIDCMTVEQYAAGLVTRFARGNLRQRIVAGDVWHHVTLTFAPPIRPVR